MIVDKHKIYCSGLCAQKAEDQENNVEQVNMEKLIADMKQEQREKEAYILKIRRTSQAFEEDVVEVEKSYQAQIESQQVLMKELSDNLEEKKLDVMKAELKLMEEKNSHLAEVLLLRNQIEELIDLNNKLDKKLLEIKNELKDNILTEKKKKITDFTVEIIECESDSSNRIMNGSHDATEEYTTLERELMETHVTPEEIETHVDDASPPQHRIMIVGDQSEEYTTLERELMETHVTLVDLNHK
ncbi:hypothetical protein JTB14_023185 [Gonioctena quinquepunctata]|nr:hypothetical protein JTB14_023185 [Gonioctena quinquepunctata]